MTTLGDLGLSSYEETAYRTLLVTGPATAGDLATASGVPRGRIYDVLNGLDARGLVRTRTGDPNRYVAVDPETAVDRLLGERLTDLEREWTRYREAAAAVRSDLAPNPPTESNFWLGSLGSDEMSTALRRHVRTAEDAVRAAVGPPYENAPWETVRSEVEAFLDGVPDAVTVGLVCSEGVLDALPDDVPRSIADRSADVTLRTVPAVELSFDVIDRAEATMDVPHPVAPGERLGVVGSRDRGVVEAFDRHFRDLWEVADPVRR